MCIALLVALSLGTAPVRGENLASLLRSAGIRPLEPPSPAIDLRLETLDGAVFPLSGSAGSWTLLTFWATWCAPCVSEMPSLERLHREWSPDGLRVIGISVEDSQALISDFVDRHGISFPVLVDRTGEAVALYHASMIPLSYIIDPRGLVVGVARGARDWARLGGLVEALLTTGRASEPQPTAWTASQDLPLQLPAMVTPPRATLELSDPQPRPGDDFSLDVTVRWEGEEEEYAILPPEIRLPPGIAHLGVSADTWCASGETLIRYRVRLRAAEEGSFPLDPVEVRYIPRLEASPMVERVTGPTVVVPPRAGLGSRLGAGGGLLLLLGIGLGIAFRRKRQRTCALEQAEPREGLRDRLHRLRRSRTEGDVESFLLGLSEIGRELDEQDQDGFPSAEVDEVLERFRFGGEMPDGEILERFQRWMERRLRDLETEERKSARRRLVRQAAS